MPIAAYAPCQNIAVRMKPGLFRGYLALFEEHARNCMVLCYPGERSFMEVIYTGIADVGPKSRPTGDKQGGERRAHTSEGRKCARAFHDAFLSFLHLIEECGANIRAAGSVAFEAFQGKFRGDFARCVPAHSICNNQQGAVIIQEIDQEPVLVILSVKPLVCNRLDLHYVSELRLLAVSCEQSAKEWIRRFKFQLPKRTPMHPRVPGYRQQQVLHCNRSFTSFRKDSGRRPFTMISTTKSQGTKGTTVCTSA